MGSQVPGAAPASLMLESAGESRHFQLAYEPEISTLWITLRTAPKPCLSLELIQDFNRLSDAIRLQHGRIAPSPNQPLKFVVLRSDSDQVFNTGGDLDFFTEAVLAGDLDAMRGYGRDGAIACRDIAWGFDASVITISLVRGVAVGGGFEVARCCDVMVAEDGASFQLPEASFGLFPASGVISVMSPRIGPRVTRKLVIDGVRLTCAEAQADDVLDEIAPAGGGEQRVREVIARLAPRHAAAVATYRGLNRMAGATTEAFQAEADLWAHAAMNLSADSLSTMKRLSRAQVRRFPVAEKEGCDRCR